MEPSQVLVRFLRRFIGQCRQAKAEPRQCFWRRGVRPCHRCWGLTFGLKEKYAICHDCQYEDNYLICTYCGKTEINNKCDCYEDYDDEELEFRCAYCDKMMIGDFRYCSSRCEKKDEYYEKMERNECYY